MIAEQWRTARKGFLITFGVVLFAYAILYLSAHLIAAQTSDSNFRSEYAEIIRDSAINQTVLMAIYHSFYWLVSAVIGRCNLLRVKSANYLLAASVICDITLSYGIFFGNINTMCDFILPGRQAFSIYSINQCPSSGIAANWLANAIGIFLVASLICRIWISRRQVRLNK